MSTVIAVASGKGGTGKTTVSAGISYALALQGRRVLAVDADAGLRNLDLHLGMQDVTLFDFMDVLSGRCDAEKAVAAHPEQPGLWLLTAPQDRPDPPVDPEAFGRMIDALRPDYDYIIIDCPAGIDAGFDAATYAADRALVVTTPDTASIRDAALTGVTLRRRGISDIRLVVNRVIFKLIEKHQAHNIDDVIDRTGIRLIGILFDDPDVIVAANCCTPILKVKRSGAAKRLYDIALRLEGAEIPLEVQ